MKKMVKIAAVLMIMIMAAGCNNTLDVVTKIDGVFTGMTNAEIEAASVEGDAPGIQFSLDSSNSKATTGIVYTNKSDPYFSVVEEPAGSGKYRVEINLRPDGQTHYRKAMFSIYQNGSGSGYMVNIGDSPTVNGWSGDASTQQNDSELQIQDNIFKVFASDKQPGAKEIYSENNAIPTDGNKNIRIEVKNTAVTYWKNFNTSAKKTVNHPYIFALNGQSDSEGPVDYKIYAGINRVVQNASRSGSGIVDVYIYLQDPEPKFAQDVWAYMYDESDGSANQKLSAILSQNPSCSELESILRKGPVYEKKDTTYREETVTLRDVDFDSGYWFIGPDDYDQDKKYPLLLVFHGGGGSTWNNPATCRSTASSYISGWKQYANSKGVFIAAPWSSKNWGFTGTQVAVNTVEEISKEYNIDADKVFLWGQSMGGHMSWRSALHFADRWGGSSPVCGGYKEYTSNMFKNLINTKIYHIWGKYDRSYLVAAGKNSDNLLRLNNLDYISLEKNGGHELFSDEFGNILDFFKNGGNKRDLYPDFVQANTVYGPGTLVQTPKLHMTKAELSAMSDNVTYHRDMPLGRYYWLDVTELSNSSQPGQVSASVANNVINISTMGVKKVDVYLHRNMVNFNSPVEIKINNTRVFYGTVQENPNLLLRQAREFQDNGRIFYNKISFTVPGQ